MLGSCEVNKKSLGDVTAVMRRIGNLTNNIKSMRNAFAHSETDIRAQRDKAFIAKWLAIKDTH